MVDYVATRGDADVPYAYVANGFRLGYWVGAQRKTHSLGRLSVERRLRLEALPGWACDPREDRWENGFHLLVDYAARHGDALVAVTYVHDGFRLGEWFHNQRGAHSRRTLTSDRERRLAAVPGWSWDPFGEQWERGLERLARYVDRRGGARVPPLFSG